MADYHKLAEEIYKVLELDLPTKNASEDVEVYLAEFFNDLILNDFSRLINLLYRLDINEEKLKGLLRDGCGEAGNIIAKAVIERQKQKEATKALYKSDGLIPGDEKW